MSHSFCSYTKQKFRPQQLLSFSVLAGFLVFTLAPITSVAAQAYATRANGDSTVTSQEVYGALQKAEGVLDTSAQTQTLTDNANELKTASAGASNWLYNC